MIEAPEKSGSINTVNHALEQGRDVYVLSDSLNEPEFSGNKMLIDEGAIPVTNPYDIINNSDFTAYNSDSNIYIKAAEQIYADNETESYEDNIDYSELDENEIKIIKMIKSGIKQFDEIVMNSEMAVSDIGYILTMLEFKGYIEQSAGKVYSIV